jgi:hypothetical protein
MNREVSRRIFPTAAADPEHPFDGFFARKVQLGLYFDGYLPCLSVHVPSGLDTASMRRYDNCE